MIAKTTFDQYIAEVREYIRASTTLPSFSDRTETATRDAALMRRPGSPTLNLPKNSKRSRKKGNALNALNSLGGFGERAFNRLALRLFELQFAHNAAYRAFCEHRRILAPEVQRWQDIPALPAVAFKALEVTSLPPEQRTAVFHSSGTTEYRRSRQFHSAASLALYETSLLTWFGVGCPGLAGSSANTSALRMIFLTPTPDSAPHSSLVHMLGTIRRAYGQPLSAFTGGLDPTGAWVVDRQQTLAALMAAVQESQPVFIAGTAFNFVHLLDAMTAADKQLCLPAGSRVMETGGYKGRSRSLLRTELHELISEGLGIPRHRIVTEYGMSELSSQAYTFPEQAAGGHFADGGRQVANDGGRIADAGCRMPDAKGSSSLALVLESIAQRNREHAKPTLHIPSSSPVSPDAYRPLSRFHFPPWARVQVISPETGQAVPEGEPGLLRIFDLANVHSVLALQTEDLGIRGEQGFELLGRAAQAEPRGCSLMAG